MSSSNPNQPFPLLHPPVSSGAAVTQKGTVLWAVRAVCVFHLPRPLFCVLRVLEVLHLQSALGIPVMGNESWLNSGSGLCWLWLCYRAQSLVPHVSVSLSCLTTGCFVPIYSLCVWWLHPSGYAQKLASQAVMCSENPYISKKTWKKLSAFMENEKFKHKLQEPLEWQLHKRLLTLPKQKPADQRPSLQDGD